MIDPVSSWADAQRDYWRSVAREQELTGAVNTLTRIVELLASKLDHDLAELRVTVDDLDHSTVSRRAFEELHTRVDALENGGIIA